MPGQFTFVIQNLAKAWPGKPVFEGITLSFLHGAKIGVVGPNGSGKSTLLKIMAGQDTEFQGEARAEAGVTAGFLPQEPDLPQGQSVREAVLEGVSQTRALLRRFEEVSARFAEPLEEDEMNKVIAEQAQIQEDIEARNAWDLDARIDMAMTALRCPPPEQKVDHISGGERRRVALCRLLLEAPDLLLLDEPTNHLDAETVAWLEHHLIAYQGTVILVTHDRYFLDNITGWTLELDRGQGIPYEGNYSSWLEQKTKRLQTEAKGEEARTRLLTRELEWVRASPQARRTKSRARLRAYEELRSQAKAQTQSHARIVIPPGPRLGDLVVEAEGLAKAYGQRLLIESLSFRLPPGGIVGITGPNGAGKTTLLRLITGAEKPDAGSLKIGETVRVGYVDQSRAELDPGKTVFQEISGGAEILDLGGRDVPARAYAAAFNFRGHDQQQNVASLSGGARNRLHLAKLLKSGANLLLLDEPTNDLDIETLRALEDALQNFAGCAVIVSHDRWFLDRIATHILAFEGNSQTLWFEGDYQSYAQDRRRRLGDKAEIPQHIKYKKFSR